MRAASRGRTPLLVARPCTESEISHFAPQKDQRDPCSQDLPGPRPGTAALTQDMSPNRTAQCAAGWESVADWFIEYSDGSTVGASFVERWAQEFPPGATVLDAGCGPGSPRSEALMRKGVHVYAVDASPKLAAAYKDRFSDARVACEVVEESPFFGIRFDAILAWGLVFLLPPDEQRRLIGRLVATLKPGGRLLFTAPRQECLWRDATTGQPSASIGSEAYKTLLSSLGAPVVSEHDDEGQNHYYSACKFDRDPPARSDKTSHPTAFGGG